jgi:predicted TIM-barrel fold metal-dependent hydrolase
MPVCLVDVDDLGSTVATMRRMRERGSRAFQVTQHKSKSLTHPDFEPLWSAAEDLGMLAYVHVNFGLPKAHASWANNGRGAAAYREAVVPLDQRAETRNLLNAMVFDGVFERHPKLVVLLTESGMSWLPFLAHELDARTTKIASDGLPQENFYRLPLKPSEYLARHVKVSPLIGHIEAGLEYFSLEEAIERYPGPEMIVYSSDFPHVEGRRDAVTAFDRLLPDDRRVREAFYGGTMAELL